MTRGSALSTPHANHTLTNEERAWHHLQRVISPHHPTLTIHHGDLVWVLGQTSSVATSNRVRAAVSSASTTSTGRTTDEEARTLSEVRRCGLGIEQAGWLVKVGSKNENWRRRWVVLHPGGLRYYASDSPTATPKGEVVFDALSTIERNPANASASGGKVTAKPHMFAIVVRGRRLVLAPPPDAGTGAAGVRETWLSSLRRVLSFYKPPGASSFASTISTELTNEALGSMADPYVFAYETLRPSYVVGQPISPNGPKIELASVLLFTAECLPPGKGVAACRAEEGPWGCPSIQIPSLPSFCMAHSQASPSTLPLAL